MTILIVGIWGLLAFQGQTAPNPTSAPKLPSAYVAEDADPKEVLPYLRADFGWSYWKPTDTDSKLRQYATPPQGWFLRELRYAPLFTPHHMDASIVAKSVGQPDYSVEGRIAWDYGNTALEGSITRNRFVEPTVTPLPDSQRTVDKIAFRHSIKRDFAISVRYRKDEEGQNFDASRDPESQSIRYENVMAAGRVGSGFLNVNASNWRYEDNRQVYPDTVGKGVHVGYQWEPNPAMGIETAVSRVWLQQADNFTSRVDTWAFNGDVALNPITDFEWRWRSRHLSMPNVQSAWVRDHRTGAAKITHRWKGWTGQLGLKITDAERLRNDASGDSDTPHWQTWEGKLAGRLNRHTRLTARASHQSLNNPPMVFTLDATPLYWSQRDNLQIKVDSSHANGSGYLLYGYRHSQNGQREVHLVTREVTAGGDWQVSPRLNLFAEFSYNAWSGASPIADYPQFNHFLSDSRLYVLGCNWTVNRRTYLTFNLTDATTFNENPLGLQDANIHAQYITLTGRYQISKRGEIGLLYAPWHYQDSLANTLNYRRAVFMLTTSTKF